MLLTDLVAVIRITKEGPALCFNKSLYLPEEGLKKIKEIREAFPNEKYYLVRLVETEPTVSYEWSEEEQNENAR